MVISTTSAKATIINRSNYTPDDNTITTIILIISTTTITTNNQKSLSFHIVFHNCHWKVIHIPIVLSFPGVNSISLFQTCIENSSQKYIILKVLLFWGLKMLRVTPAGVRVIFSPRSPPCLESQGFQFDPTFLWSSLVLLPSAIAFMSSFLCYWPIHLTFISLHLIFLKDRLFRLALVLFLSGQMMNNLGGGMCSACCHMALLSGIICIIYLFLNTSFISLFYTSFLHLVLKRLTETVNGTSIS